MVRAEDAEGDAGEGGARADARARGDEGRVGGCLAAEHAEGARAEARARRGNAGVRLGKGHGATCDRNHETRRRPGRIAGGEGRAGRARRARDARAAPAGGRCPPRPRARVAEYRAGNPIGARDAASGSSLRTVAAAAGWYRRQKKFFDVSTAIARFTRCARKNLPVGGTRISRHWRRARRSQDERAARPTHRLVALAEVSRRGPTARVASTVRVSRLVPRVRSRARAGWSFPWIPSAGLGGWRRRSS